MEKQPRQHIFPWQESPDGTAYLNMRIGNMVFQASPYNTLMYLFPDCPEADHIFLYMGDDDDNTMRGIRLWREHIDAVAEGAFTAMCDQMFDHGFEVASDEEPSMLDLSAFEQAFNRLPERRDNTAAIARIAMTNFDEAWEYYSEEWG